MGTVLARIGFVLVLCALLLFVSLPAQVYADGGAPNLAYVSGTAHGIGVIDIFKQQKTATLNVTGDPAMILLSVDGRLLYVTEPALKRIAVIATATKSTLCTAAYPGHPTLLTLDPGTNTLYTAGMDATEVEAIDPMSCEVRFRALARAPVMGLAVAVVGSGLQGGNGNQLWVATMLGLTIFDSSGKQLAQIPMPDQPHYLCIPPGPMAYVTTEQGTIDAVTLQSRQVLPRLLTGGSFGPMDYDAVTGEVYVPDRQHDRIDVLSPLASVAATSPREPVRMITLSAAPEAVAITSDGQLGFIAVQDGTVVMVDIPGRSVVNTFQVGGQPHFIITGLYPSFLSLTPQQSTLLGILNNLLHYAASIVLVLAAIIAIIIGRRRASRLQ